MQNGTFKATNPPTGLSPALALQPSQDAGQRRPVGRHTARPTPRQHGSCPASYGSGDQTCRGRLDTDVLKNVTANFSRTNETGHPAHLDAQSPVQRRRQAGQPVPHRAVDVPQLVTAHAKLATLGREAGRPEAVKRSPRTARRGPWSVRAKRVHGSTAAAAQATPPRRRVCARHLAGISQTYFHAEEP